MNWDVDDSQAVLLAFANLHETNSTYSDITAIRFQADPDSFPVKVQGTATCPGCDKVHEFSLDIYKNFNASTLITCPKCKVQFIVYGVYRPSQSNEEEITPIYMYSDLYSYRKGQQLLQVKLHVSEVG